MSYSIIGLFDKAADATATKADLIALGVPAGDINVKAQVTGGTTTAAAPAEEKSFWAEIKGLFSSEDEHYGDYYAEGTRRGSTLLTANVSEALADRASDVFHAHNAVNVDEKAAEWSKSGYAGYKAPALADTAAYSASAASAGTAVTARKATGNTAAVVADTTVPPVALQEVEERLAVGKRQVNRGGVRILRRVVETPVEQSVSLHEEKVNVARRAVDRDLTGADVDAAFTDKTIELTETGEEAIAAKSARVTGEVVIDKTGADRTETIRDTVRKTQVEVERVPGQEVSSTSTTKTLDTDVASTSTTKKVGAGL